MVVGVIVSKTARQVDRLFDYDVPMSLCGKIQIGSRVIVPFGAKNMLCEGYVFEIKENGGGGKLKQIQSVKDALPAFDEKGAELIKWLCDKTLCSHIEAVSLLVATGTNTSFEKWVCLSDMPKNERDALLEKSPIKRDIVDEILKAGEKMELSSLVSVWKTNIRPHISALEKSGIITIIQKDSVSVKERFVRYASLVADESDAAKAYTELVKKAPKQAKIIDVLRLSGDMILSDLLRVCDTTHTSANALYKKGIIKIYEAQLKRNPSANKNIESETFKELTKEQQKVKDALCSALEKSESKPFLLHGVTGSGKTEVYMHLIAHAINLGKTAIVLVPEISLTPLMTKRFISRFKDRVAILHSALSLGERYDEYMRIKRGEVDVVVGARSAIFAPLDNIGVVIIDEEHENTYKSEMSPRYHARDVAIKRAGQYGALVVLASATPSIESYYKAKTGEYQLLELNERINKKKMPTVYVVDMRKELENGNRSMFSDMLSHELLYNIEHNEQSILFLNRRGFSTFVSCRSCGYVAKCPHCNISLTYHRNRNTLECHYCGYTQENYTVCPECNSRYIKYFGAGTQKLEEELKNKFEGVSTVRMDFDTTMTKSAHEKLLSKFENEKADVLIGTQMVSKGLDFENVTLVGVVAADASLYIDDYKSGERTFNLITQVCGRAGRGSLEGRAIVQTYTPEHSAIIHAKNHDYKGFYEDEIKLREAMNYPPFCELISIIITGKNEKEADECAKTLASRLSIKLKNECKQKTLLLGPSVASISKIKDKYRYSIAIKCEDADGLNDILKSVMSDFRLSAQSKYINVSIDKNPNSLS